MVGDGYVSPKVYQEIEASARAAGQKHLDALVAKARKAGVRAKGLLLEGIPHDRIVRAAKAKRVDLVVMGTHGRTGLARFFLGSVAGRGSAMAGGRRPRAGRTCLGPAASTMRALGLARDPPGVLGGPVEVLALRPLKVAD